MLWEKLAHRFPTEKYIRGGLVPALAMAPKDARYLGYAVYVLARAVGALHWATGATEYSSRTSEEHDSCEIVRFPSLQESKNYPTRFH